MKKAWFFSLLILAAVIGVVLTSKPSPNSAAQSSTGVPPVMETIPRQAGRPPFTSAPSVPAPAQSASSEASQLAPFLSAPITLQDGGSKRPFELAADEIYVRQAGGDNRVIKVPKTDTPKAFAAAIEKARAEHGTEPELVLYPAGLPRNEYTRRIVTREVIINANSKAEADLLADSADLVFKKNLPFAPNAFVYEAHTSLDALNFQLKNNEINMAKVSTQLAKQSATMAMPNDPYIQLQWHLNNFGQKQKDGNYSATPGIDINVESVWNYPETNSANYNRGQGVTIGIVDDSLQWNHPDLSPNMRNELNWDWNQGDADPSPYYDEDSHGTACAGVAAARGNNRRGVSGVAPEASLVGMRLISGPSTDLDEAEAMAWKSDQIEIKSNSWGYPSVYDGGFYSLYKNSDLANTALKYAIDFGRNGKGTIFTFAAGNSFEYYDFVNNIDVPSGARVEFSDYQGSMYTIAVGAIDSSGRKSYYSQIGSALVVSAPSNGEIGIMTTDRTGDYGYNYGFSQSDFASSGDVTKTFGGTSSACPTVSGVIALMLEKNPDLGWRDVQEILICSANNTFDAAGWETNGAGIKFNYNYGAGLVDAEAAVNMADGWSNLGSQKSQTISNTDTETIAAGATVNRTFTVNGTNLRVEHVTLRLTVEDIKKGDLTITLKSQNGTESIFCEPHDDDQNSLDNWTFMTVRNWGEMSNGNWTLSITNHGATLGSLTNAELVVYGTEQGDATNPAPIVSLKASKTSLFVGANLTLTATAIDKKADGSAGSVKTLEAFVDGATLGESTNGTWTIQAKKAGNYNFTVNATDGEDAPATSTSNTVEIEVLEAPIAAWNFDTTTISPVPLATTVQSTKQYAANFGSGNLIFGENLEDSNIWSFKNGEIWKADGTSINAKGEMWNDSLENNALLLRGGKNIGAEGKCLIFEFSMVNRGQLNVSYAFSKNSKGFTTHIWSYSTDGTNWNELQTVTPAVSTVLLDPIPVLSEQAKAYLRVQFTGATAANGENLIDNIYFSASPITVDPVSENFTVLSRTTAKAQAYGHGSEPSQANETQGATSQAESGGPEDSQNLDWVLEPSSIHEMTVHAVVVEGGQFLNAPGSLLSANVDGRVLGLAEPVPQTTRYDLGITSSDPAPEPLRLKVYDSKSKAVLVLEEKVPFASGSTIGSPSTPKRYKVAYQEAEQVVPVSPGWNTFTTAVDPDPATLSGAFADYDYSEGDELVGPDVQSVVVNGKWKPVGMKLEPKETYSLLRQAQNNAQIVLKGKALPQETPKPPHDRYGIWMDLPNGSIITMDWLDADGDEIDDRFQPGPGMPTQRRAPLPLAPVSAAQSAPAASSAGASNSATKASNYT
ncbi:MAG: S8 family serine peptidase, partial [Verrucomicrobia bacterium]|nr:S8 family serine peptidase [Verrucomicrobiota bacterium]